VGGKNPAAAFSATHARMAISYYEIPVQSCTATETRLLRLRPDTLTLRHAKSATGTALAIWCHLFAQHWRRLRYGICTRGAVYELALERQPTLHVTEGYLRVVASRDSHFHLCFRAGDRASACVRAALFGRRLGGAPGEPSRGIRFWNAHGDQMLTLFLIAPAATQPAEGRLSKDPLFENLLRLVEPR
jgi:hypothetical protein